MSRKFKVSVSDWEIIFDSGETVVLNTLIRESVSMFADGKVNIKLNNATFDPKFISLFKEGAKVTNIKQKFDLRNCYGEITDEEIEYDYVEFYIKNVTFYSFSNSVVEVSVYLTNK